MSSAANGSDIEGHWAESVIKKMIKANILNGYPDGSFRPDAPISRAEFATAVVKAFNIPAGSGTIFSDTASHWARSSIATLEGRGIISGYSPTIFGPDDPLTREQMTAIVVKAANLDQKAGGDRPDFDDKSSISVWASAAVAEATQLNLISGYPDDTFQPQGSASRAEAVTVLNKASNLK